MRTSLGLAVSVVLLLATSSVSYAGIVVSNLSDPSGFHQPADGTTYAAAESFTTASGNYILDSVTVAAFSSSFGSSELRLYSDSGGLPGTLIDSLGSQTIFQGNQLATYDSPVSITLQANTTYWLTLGEMGKGNFAWNGTLSTAQTSPISWTIGGEALQMQLGNPGVVPTWEPIIAVTPVSLQFAISASSVPEPSSFLLGLIALGAMPMLWHRKRSEGVPRLVQETNATDADLIAPTATWWAGASLNKADRTK